MPTHPPRTLHTHHHSTRLLQRPHVFLLTCPYTPTHPPRTLHTHYHSTCLLQCRYVFLLTCPYTPTHPPRTLHTHHHSTCLLQCRYVHTSLLCPLHTPLQHVSVTMSTRLLAERVCGCIWTGYVRTAHTLSAHCTQITKARVRYNVHASSC